MLKIWGKFVAALDVFSAEHQLLIPSEVIKQRIFILLINAITLDIKEKKIDRSVALNIILQLCELIETFVLIVHPSSAADEGKITTEILKLADILLPLSLPLSLSLSLSHTHTHTHTYYKDYKDEEDVILLKLAHNYRPELNTRHCSQEVRDVASSSNFVTTF